MPLCICALTTSGVTAMPQSTAHTTRSTVILSPFTVTSAICATTEPKDSCTATTRPRPFSFGNGASHPAFSAASLSAPTWRGCLPSSASRKATGSCRAACASSSIITSLEYAMCVFSTERHHSTGTPTVGADQLDRKSTRLNSSHLVISYAVFCLKKKATDRSRARRCVEACVYGTLDFVGYPRFPSSFFFNDTATTEIYTLSLHDALPISCASSSIITSLEYAMCVFSTERHHSTGTPTVGADQ